MDEISKLYKISQKFDKVKRICFCVNLAFGIGSFFLENSFLRITQITQIVLAFLFVIIDLLNDGVLWYNAENSRRKNAIDNAYQTNLTQYKTSGYYNNELPPSYFKYTINIFESNYFSLNVAKAMLPRVIAKVVFSLIILIVSGICLVTPIVLIVAETIFSSCVVIESIELIIYEIRMKHLFDSAYTQLVINGITGDQLPWCIYYTLEYESVKAHYKVRLDSNLFEKMNHDLTKKWEELEKLIKH